MPERDLTIGKIQIDLSKCQTAQEFEEAEKLWKDMFKELTEEEVIKLNQEIDSYGHG